MNSILNPGDARAIAALFSLIFTALLPSRVFSKNADPGYVQTNLVANKADYHPKLVDDKMVNAWGIALRPPGAGGHIWISNAATGTSSEYIGDVGANPLHQDGLKIVQLNEPGFTDHGYAFVTGQAYNSASDAPGQPEEFSVSGSATNLKEIPAQIVKGGFVGPAKFVFVTEDGCINAWSASTTVAMDAAPVMVDYSKTAVHFPYAANCVFTGVALTNNSSRSEAFKKLGGNHLFATDMRNNTVLVFDNKWKDVTPTFDFQTPTTVGHLHPFNIVDCDGHLFVSYAQFDPEGDEGQEQMLGAGLGHIVEYDESGNLVMDFHTHGVLNAPWGIALAPSTFGEVANRLLVANFGDGTIATFDRRTGNFMGYLRDSDTKIISIDGIWGLAFGNGHSLGDAHALYFTAGPNAEQDGLFGRLNSRALEMAHGGSISSTIASLRK